MIYLEVPSLPPSINHVYMTVLKKAGKKSIPIRILTTEGQAYKKETSAHLIQNYPAELAKFKKNEPYVVHFRFHIPNLLTKGYPKTATSRYKKLDATNRIKVLEDVLADVSSVDDSCNLVVIADKVMGEEKTQIWAWEFKDSPFTDVLRSLR